MACYGRIFNIAGSVAVNRNLLSIRNGLPNLQPCATLKAKALEKLGLPPRPKRPLTPYFRFMSAERANVIANDPSLRTQDVVKRMAEKWAHYDPEEKKMLQEAYSKELLNYTKQVMIYEQSITPEQKQAIKDMKIKQEDKAEKLKFKKKTEDLGKPKRPPTAFLQYLQERRYSKGNNGKLTDWLKIVGEEWRAMSLDEKAKYQFESQKLMDQYRKDMREWEEKMVRMGHFDVVRVRGLLRFKTDVATKSE